MTKPSSEFMAALLAIAKLHGLAIGINRCRCGFVVGMFAGFEGRTPEQLSEQIECRVCAAERAVKVVEADAVEPAVDTVVHVNGEPGTQTPPAPDYWRDR